MIASQTAALITVAVLSVGSAIYTAIGPDPGPLSTLEVQGLDPGLYWWEFEVTPEAGGGPVQATAKVEVRE